MQHILLGAPIAPAIKRIGPKTVLIHGRADQVTPLARMQRLAQQSGAKLIVVPGGHDEYVPAIRDVLAGTGR
jgi:pimeloyl-ACP methyl ester carboxylesterase